MKIKYFLISILCAVHVFGSSNIHITSDTVELDGAANEVLATGNVIVTQDDITLKSGYVKYNQDTQIARLFNHVSMTKEALSLECDTAVANGVTNKIEANGHISMIYETIKATAEHALFDIDNQLVTLTGNPIAYQEGGYLKGTMIQVDLEKIKVTTTGQAEIKLDLDKL